MNNYTLDTSGGKCITCNGTGVLVRCDRCGVLYRHIHKYSDCGSPQCEGERSTDIKCPDCVGRKSQ